MTPQARQSVEHIRQELAKMEAGDPAVRQHLEQLAEIEGHFGGAENAPPRDKLAGSVSDAIRRFEVKHPAITGWLSEIAAALG